MALRCRPALVLYAVVGFLALCPTAEASRPVNVTTARVIRALDAKLRALKTQEEITQEEQDAATSRRKSTCSVNVLRVVNFLAKFAFNIHGLMETCPQAQKAPPGVVTPPVKGCIIATAGLITSLSQIATALAIAASTCGNATKVANNSALLCSPPVSAMFIPLAQFVGASTVVSATCKKQASLLPKDIELERRLAVRPPRLWTTPEDRKWEIAECVVDGLVMVQIIGQLANSLANGVISCPTMTNGTYFQREVSRAACTFDASFFFFTLSRIALFLALTVEHCAPGDQQDSLCVAGATGLLASCLAWPVIGSGLYLGCQIGPERQAILQGTSPLVFEERRRRLETEEFLGQLSGAAGHGRRLTKDSFMEELAAEARAQGFETGEELWLSMGYNLSDANASWLQDDPEGEAVVARGERMVADLQTTREEPAKELLERGPEEELLHLQGAPEAPLDPSDDASTLNCSEEGVAYGLALPGHAVSLERGVGACQARCARTPGCARFSYWRPGRHCRLHGVLAEPETWEPLWISGPPGCREAQISPATLRTLRRRDSCFHPHAVYEPSGGPAEPEPGSSILDCQRRCQQLRGCVHFMFSELDGTCSFADETAVKLQPVLYTVAGPRHCPDAALALEGLAGISGRKSAVFRSGATRTLFSAACVAVASVALVMSISLVLSRRIYQRVAQQSPSTE